MQSMAERMQVTNDVDGTTSGTHEVHSMHTPQFKVWARPVCYRVPLEFVRADKTNSLNLLYRTVLAGSILSP